MTRPGHALRNPGLFPAAVGMGFSCVLVAVVILANRFGIAVTPDSAHYLSAARNLAEGKGLVVTQIFAETWGASLPYTAWPPIFPMAMALLVLTGVPLFDAAVAVNAVAMILLVGSLSLLSYSVMGRSATVLLLAFLVCTTALAKVTSMAWSEPLFMGFTYSCLWLVSMALRTFGRRIEWLFWGLAGLTLMLAVGTRYMGMSAAVACSLALVAFHWGRPVRWFVRRLGLLVLPAAVLLVLYFSRNLALTSSLAGQPRQDSPYDLPGISLSILSNLGRDTAGDFAAGAEILGLPLAIVAGVVAAVGLVLILTAIGPRLAAVTSKDIDSIVPVFLPVVLFVVIYYSSVGFLGWQVHNIGIPDSRWLAPGYPGLLAVAGMFLYLALRRGGVSPLGHWRSLSLAAGLCALLSVQAGGTLHFLFADEGEPEPTIESYWRTRVWDQPYPDGMEALALLDTDEPIWTNVPEYVDLVGGRSARRLPADSDRLAAVKLRWHAGRPVFVDRRYQRGLMTREQLQALGPGIIRPLGDHGQASLLRVETQP